MNSGVMGFHGYDAPQLIRELLEDRLLANMEAGTWGQFECPAGYTHFEFNFFLPGTSRGYEHDELYVAYNDKSISGATTITHKGPRSYGNGFQRDFYDTGQLSYNPSYTESLGIVHTRSTVFFASGELAPRMIGWYGGCPIPGNPAACLAGVMVNFMLYPDTVQRSPLSLVSHYMTGLPGAQSRVQVYGLRKARLMIVE